MPLSSSPQHFDGLTATIISQDDAIEEREKELSTIRAALAASSGGSPLRTALEAHHARAASLERRLFVEMDAAAELRSEAAQQLEALEQAAAQVRPGASTNCISRQDIIAENVASVCRRVLFSLFRVFATLQQAFNPSGLFIPLTVSQTELDLRELVQSLQQDLDHAGEVAAGRERYIQALQTQLSAASDGRWLDAPSNGSATGAEMDEILAATQQAAHEAIEQARCAQDIANDMQVRCPVFKYLIQHLQR